MADTPESGREEQLPEPRPRLAPASIPDESQPKANIITQIQQTLAGETEWAYNSLQNVFSWNGIGWFVALFIGLWGSMIGIGQFAPAYCFGGIAWLLCLGKWAHATHIHEKERKTTSFVIGSIVMIIIAGWTIRWTIDRAEDSRRQSANLNQLAQIPELRSKVDRLPKLEQYITNLQSALDAITGQLATKQSLIDGLNRVLITQNDKLAALGKSTQADILGEPASSVDVEISHPVNINQFSLVIFNNGKRNMYDVTITVSELIESGDSWEVMMKKIQETKTYSIGLIKPLLNATGIKLPYAPPDGPGFSFDVACRAGGRESDVYRRTMENGKYRVKHEQYKDGKLVLSKTY
jgi:hypothetical protein